MSNYIPIIPEKYNKGRADKVVNFIQSLKHVKGKFAGRNFILEPFQEKIIRDIFGTINEDNTRQYRTALIMLPRRNGKTVLSAAIMLYLLFGDKEYGAEIFSCASTREQANLCFNVASEMVRQHPVLRKNSKIIDSKKRIVFAKKNSFYASISADAGAQHGLDVHGCCFDELHVQKNEELWNVMETGKGNRVQPLTIAISTAGFDRNTVCYRQYEYAKKVLEGVITDDTFYPVIYEAPTDADWTSPEVWQMCNPALGVFRSKDEIKSACEKAKEMPHMENYFRRLYLNQWTSSETKWIDVDSWNGCKSEIDLESLKGRTCYGGLDLSSTLDITAFVLCFPPLTENDKYIALCRFWLPEENIQKRRDLAEWARQGFITLTPGNVIDYEFIKHQIFEDANNYSLQDIAFDPWNATQIGIQLSDEGITVAEFRQGFKTMSPAVKELEAGILSKQILHDGNPVLTWMVSNVMIKQDPAGNVKIDKSKSTDKVDGVVALAMAHARAVLNQNNVSVYESRGVLTI